ncbi:unnamed protein product [Hymenolepis diminuta]|uniref:YTH domain-containing protein n=1 Tax=Hymenolepis diminuta TaxID=6216 RepID=A0A564YHN7_HYMDI|nr:unnamed protein product [Hymenolepis diminuta]
MSELDSGSKDDEDLGVKEENAADFKDFNDPPNNDETKKPEANLQIVDGGEMISPNDSDSEQNSTELDKNNANTELEDTSEKRHSPVVWEGNNDVDTVRVDTPENDFSRESEDEHSKDNKAREIRTTNESFAPASSEIMDPDVLNNFDQLFINTKYFLIKSNNYENVVIAKENNAWSTPVGNEHRLNKAFDESNNVILIFSVRESGKFQGFARIASPPDSRLKINWVLPPRMNPDMLSHPFKLDWITKQELPFNNVAHLTNSWNEGKLVKIGRDGQEIEPVCGQALCRSFPLDSAEMISEIVKKIVPKNPKSADGNRRRNLSDRIGTTTDRIRRPKDLGFHNPSSVGLLGNATSSRPPTVPPLMSSIDLSSAVAAMAALKSNHQPRGSLLQTTSPAIDISHFAAPAVLPNLIPQPTGPDPTAFSTLLNTHAPAINRIFNPQDINQQRQHPLSGRERRYRSRSSSRESSGRYRRDYRRRYAEEGEDDYYRDFRSRLGRADAHYKDTSLSLILTLLASLCFVFIIMLFTDIILIIMVAIFISSSIRLIFGSSYHFSTCVAVAAACITTVFNPNIFSQYLLLLYMFVTLGLIITKDSVSRYHHHYCFIIINNTIIINLLIIDHVIKRCGTFISPVFY